jgi:hypothetical protein
MKRSDMSGLFGQIEGFLIEEGGLSLKLREKILWVGDQYFWQESE